MEREPVMKAEVSTFDDGDQQHDDVHGDVVKPPRASLEMEQSHHTAYSQLHEWAGQSSHWYRSQSMRSRSSTIIIAVAALFLVVYGTFHAASSPLPYTTSYDGAFAPMYDALIAEPGMFPLDLQAAVPADICVICNCTMAPKLYEPSAAYSFIPARPLQKHIWPGKNQADVNEFMRQTILDMYCAQQHLDKAQALKLLRRSLHNLPDMMTWSLGSLELRKPTIYMTTATSPNGKSGPQRQQYFRRHGRALRAWMDKEAKAAQKTGFQVIWIVAEDDTDIDPIVSQTLRRAGVPYVYFAYGLTKAYGNAQKNAVLQVAYSLSRPQPRGLLGHGPVYGLDDDNKILPELLTLMTKLVRVGVFPVGNLRAGDWEKPTIDDGVVTGTDSPWQRKFSLDYGAFAFNSTMLGTMISGPSFWKHTGYGGEDQFVAQMAGSMRDMEPLCGQNKEQDCHFVWHNQELTELERMTDDEEVAYVEAFGAEKLFRELGYVEESEEPPPAR
ncbi:hypothetical protein EJ05DRAFT_478466 [Pseudovirgaria hyperparasitica]|uniref:Uncharacterized protein n=1 Tax=Pseudovirgaria hyperparasitica TaxID=470096 RepID=A0A6A6VYZ5_9PEZI|nr:uncharacterized protein EJ05DRAFT_478466 [Pseudovirgaria hyperparasitica]KAF2755455.1 hypothetical protein EJ05DRAFT_478466 [Pseudovirgaria hyperparasitica]